MKKPLIGYYNESLCKVKKNIICYQGIFPFIEILLTIEWIITLIPPIIIPWFVKFNILPFWTIYSYFTGILLCAFLWEIYVTFGLVGGLCVKKREPNDYPILGSKSMNWLLMSSLDSFLVLHLLMMGSAIYICPPYNETIFTEWRFDVLCVMWFTGYGQGILVALFHRYLNKKNKQHLLSGNNLSWMPISPILPLTYDPIINLPILRYCTFRIQIPWLFMPIIWNVTLIYGIFEHKIEYTLLTFIIIIIIVSCYMIYFSTIYPLCKGIPSIPINHKKPFKSWNSIIISIIKPFIIIISLFLISSWLAFNKN